MAFKVHVWVVPLLAGFLLSGCSVEIEHSMANKRLQVREDVYRQDVSLSQIDDSFLKAQAHRYHKHGDGALEITVFYDAKSRSNTAMKASDSAANIAAKLQGEGVRDVKANIVPAKGLGADARVILSYLSYTAHAPEDCPVMSGYNDTLSEINPDYQFGCTVETAFAKQIARPKDLAGKAKPNAANDGRRTVNVLEGYRSGAPSQELSGETASE